MAEGDTSKSARGAIQAAIGIVLVLTLFGAVQFLSGRHNVRFDLTPTQRFLLSPYARQAAEGFNLSGTLYAFYDSQRVADRRNMLDLLDQFQSYAPGLSYELVDLDRKPGLAKKYDVSRYNTGVLELENGDRIPVRAISEDAITAILLRLTSARRGRVCFVTGHNEGHPGDKDERNGLSKLTHAIESEGFAISSLVTVQAAPPPECVLLVFASPTHNLVPGEADTVERYVRSGGRALFLLDPGNAPSVDELLARFGISAGTNIIVDEASRMIGADSFVPQVDRFRQEVFGDRLGAAVILPVARTIRATAERPEGVRLMSLAGTSDSSWARMNTTEVPAQDVEIRPELDQPGPLSISVQATLEPTTGEIPGRVIAVGDSDFVTNAHLDTLGNRDFILALVGVLAEDPSMIGARQDRSQNSERPLVLTASQTRTIFWIAVVVLPGLSALVGIVLALLRRRQRGGR